MSEQYPDAVRSRLGNATIPADDDASLVQTSEMSRFGHQAREPGMKRASRWLVAVATTAGIGLAGIGPAAPASAQSAAAPYCGIYWGSLPKTANPHGAGLLTNIRAGQHPCFDRLVFDLDGREAG